MTGLRYSPLHVTEFCGEMQGKFKVGLARLKSNILFHCAILSFVILNSIQWRVECSNFQRPNV